MYLFCSMTSFLISAITILQNFVKLNASIDKLYSPKYHFGSFPLKTKIFLSKILLLPIRIYLQVLLKLFRCQKHVQPLLSLHPSQDEEYNLKNVDVIFKKSSRKECQQQSKVFLLAFGTRPAASSTDFHTCIALQNISKANICISTRIPLRALGRFRRNWFFGAKSRRVAAEDCARRKW